MSIVEELRAKKSRDNRELLDRAAAEIEELDRNLVAAYKKIEELEGRILPCAVGEVVYQVVDKIYESEIRGVIFDTENYAFDARAIGKSIFLTKEEAERKLAEREEGR